MSRVSVPCHVKSTVALQVGDVRTSQGRPGVLVIDVTFPSLAPFEMLCDMTRVLELRLILRQPSPLWLSFTVEELQIYQQGPKSPSMTFPKWLSHPVPCEQPIPLPEGLPDPSRVSSEVQQMWALTEMIRASHTSTRIGRFDVDGCYDLNLLSYT
ncbi:nicolin-1 isoform X3 [Ictidomys tridecemlineatus]|uniref:nicolin-1 isoform X2 n=1 Tax=Ictidomys tridecemlineatus TaxID=43179 RepID=UPI001A9F1A26|nr:nicolin-1 isoform X2 [Ictidomys tridecemlineatus]